MLLAVCVRTKMAVAGPVSRCMHTVCTHEVPSVKPIVQTPSTSRSSPPTSTPCLLKNDMGGGGGWVCERRVQTLKAPCEGIHWRREKRFVSHGVRKYCSVGLASG